jgi:alkane 1-monooxygenase
MENVLTTAAETWKDDKRYAWPFGALVPLAPFIFGAFAQMYDVTFMWWFTPFFIFGLIPFWDWRNGEDTSNPPESAVKELEKQKYYRYVVYLALGTMYVSFFWTMYTLGTADLTLGQKLGLAISMGIITGIGVNTSHELGHKANTVEKFLAKVALAPSMYGNFFVEHNRGHHVRVATPEDPASSRFGESLYEFLPRSIVGAHVSAWELEKKRLARLNKGPWTWQNDNFQAWAMTVVLFGAMIALFGWSLVPYLLLQAFVGIIVFETVNYLEHYGLCRQKMEDGRYERCRPEHSWNSNHRITNLALYQLQRHSDHHANPTRQYQALRHFDDAPELPNGYAGMIVLAAVPPLWFKVMNPRVVKHYKGDMTKANIKPSIREKVIAQYAARQA